MSAFRLPTRRGLLVAAALLLVTALSLSLRSTALHAPFWIDEGLSVGISSHRLADIPSVLRQDGSPPLYYLTLGVWMHLFGDGQATTHVLSLVFALLTVPAAWWAGRSLFGTRTGWFAALLAAVNPFLTYYAQETRMYSLVCLLSLVMVALMIHVFAFGHRRYRIPAGVAAAALVYSHNWGLFVAAGSVLVLIPIWRAARDRRAVLRDGALVYGVTAVLYLPWLPTLLFQAVHTGAPWSERPSVLDVVGPISGIAGGAGIPFALLIVACVGLGNLLRTREREDGSLVGGAGSTGPVEQRRAVWLLVATPAAGLTLAWISSQASPAFTGRYFAVFLGPLLLIAAAGLAHMGRTGVLGLLVALALWYDPRTAAINHKSNVRTIATRLAPHVRRGDLVVSVHPEQTPLLHYYFPPGLRYATALGPMPDTGVFDWRDALDRLRAARPGVTLAGLVGPMASGQRLVLVLPIIATGRWGAPWTSLVRRRSGQWQRDADRAPRLRRLMAIPHFKHHGRLPRGVRVVVYERR